MVEEFQNVCLIVSDSLRRRDIAEREDIAPFLSRVSGEGISIKKFYSTSPWTVPSHASMFSGELPSEHGCTTENTYFDCEFRLLDELDSRYKLGLSENRLLCDETGFSSDFDEFSNFQAGMKGGKSWKEVWEKDDEFEGSFEKYRHFMKLVFSNRDFASLKGLAGHIYSKLSKKGFNRRYISEVFDSVQEELYTERDSFIFANIVPTHYPYTFGEKERREFFSDVEEEELREAIAGYNHEEYLGGGPMRLRGIGEA